MRLGIPSRIGSNWPIKVTALGLAMVLWAAVSAEQPTTQLVPIRLDIQTPTTKTLLQSVPMIRGLYAGSARELDKLSSAPPSISKVIPDTVTESFFTINLSLQDVSVTSDAAVELQDIFPRSVVVALDEVFSRPVRVVSRVDVRAASGYRLMRSAVSPESVLVSGPKARVERIGSVFTIPALWNNVRDSIRRTVAIDTSAFGVVRLSQYEVEIDARVEQITQRTFTQVPVIIAGGEWESIPPTVQVTVTGPRSRLNAMTTDSLSATAPAAAVEGDMVPVSIRVSRGLSVTFTPDSVQAQRIIL
ncbi:MAG: hypothetical protein IH876_00355 [Gemmatimonadetes bacterium]|nr:hypothetical protein [Gemmatimonadota bacterium]MCH7714565.1 hypothetical protein [Gemmatimonadota bacterium]